MPALVPDTSCPPPRVPLNPRGSGPRDLSQACCLPPRAGGVEAEDTLPSNTPNTVLTLALSSLPGMSMASGPASISRDSSVTWWGLEGGSAAWLAREARWGLLGTHGGS